MSTQRFYVMVCPAELIERGDVVARTTEGPFGYVAQARPGIPRVIIDVRVDHGAGPELETWRPRPDTDLYLRCPLTTGDEQAARLELTRLLMPAPAEVDRGL